MCRKRERKCGDEEVEPREVTGSKWCLHEHMEHRSRGAEEKKKDKEKKAAPQQQIQDMSFEMRVESSYKRPKR